MDKYIRIKGGEKTEKTGVKWDKDELLLVYHLYKELDGTKLHEHNPDVQNLGIVLGRSTRSVEAQLCMYRNLDKGGDYSHGNMNKLSKEIWIEMEGNTYQQDKTPSTVDSNLVFKEMEQNYNQPTTNIPFPEGLLEWDGHKKGGVKKPFDSSTGRPNGKVIKTMLTDKLDEWVIASPKDRPRIILLIGGPGNGKTDALEYLVTQIDDQFNTNYFQEISLTFNSNTPRTIKIEIDNTIFDCNTLTLVQDASVGISGKKGEQCLVEDLEHALINENSLYISCINRGVLAEALNYANEKNPRIYKVLNNIVKSLTQTFDPKPLWPIENYNSIGVWPMDVESLVEIKEPLTNTPAYQIIKDALIDTKWDCKECSIDEKKLCPFFHNKSALQDDLKLTGLLNLLHDFEVIENKRWSFRELFSLVSYLIVGFGDEFKGKSPCKWVKNQIGSLTANNKENIKSLWSLNSHLYHFKLFNSWPKFNSISRSKDAEIKQIFGSSTGTKDLFNYFTYNQGKDGNKPDIAKIIDNNLCKSLDPCLLNGDGSNNEILTAPISEIEANFSYSIKSGYEIYKDNLNSIEDLLFQGLTEIENELDASTRFESAVSSMKVDQILSTLRQIAIRYFKRIHLTGLGITKEDYYLKNYKKLDPINDKDEENIETAADLFGQMVQTNDGLEITLNSSLCQPQLANDTRISILAREINIECLYINNEFKDVPRANAKIFTIDFNKKIIIPVSYKLFKALNQINQGIRLASLPSDVLAMIDNIKSKLAGQLVRNRKIVEGSQIKIGASNSKYKIKKSSSKIKTIKR